MSKTAVYSGSFNPLHIGHLAIIEHLLDKGGFDCVYLIVSPKNPLKDGICCDSGPERHEAAVNAVSRRFDCCGHACHDRNGTKAKVKVDDIELKMPEPHYTIRTLDALRQREPDNDFTLIIGADNLADIRRWREYRRILKEYGVAVHPRTGTDLEKVSQDLLNEDPDYKIVLLDAPMIDISSTEIREMTASGRDVSHLLM